MLNCVFNVFKAFLAFSRIKWLKRGLFSRKLVTKNYLVYIIMLKWWQSKTIVICLKLRPKMRVWGFLSIFKTISHYMVLTWFVWNKTWHTTRSGTCYCVEMVRIQNNSHTLDITCKDAFLRFLSVFGTFSHKVVQTWFVWHKTWHTKLFAINYCVEIVRI